MTSINNAPGYRCAGVPATISGFITGTDVGFVANFAPCANTITSWKGKFNPPNKMPTSWILHYVDNNGDFKELKDDDEFSCFPEAHAEAIALARVRRTSSERGKLCALANLQIKTHDSNADEAKIRPGPGG